MCTNMELHDWYQFKLFIHHSSGVSFDALHVLFGFAIFLLAARLFNQSVASPIPWAAAMLLEIGNEGCDLLIELWPELRSQLGEAAKDILLTMTLPTLVMLIARWRPCLLAPNAGQSRLADD